MLCFGVEENLNKKSNMKKLTMLLSILMSCSQIQDEVIKSNVVQKIRPNYASEGNCVLVTTGWHGFEIVAETSVYSGYEYSMRDILDRTVWNVPVINDSIKKAQREYIQRGLDQHHHVDKKEPVSQCQ